MPVAAVTHPQWRRTRSVANGVWLRFRQPASKRQTAPSPPNRVRFCTIQPGLSLQARRLISPPRRAATANHPTAVAAVVLCPREPAKGVGAEHAGVPLSPDWPGPSAGGGAQSAKLRGNCAQMKVPKSCAAHGWQIFGAWTLNTRWGGQAPDMAAPIAPVTVRALFARLAARPSPAVAAAFLSTASTCTPCSANRCDERSL